MVFTIKRNDHIQRQVDNANIYERSEMKENNVVDKDEAVKNAINAFNEGYRLGREYGDKVLNDKRKINVEHSNENDSELEFTEFDDGIINYGRSLPF